MLDIHYIQNHPNEVIHDLVKRGVDNPQQQVQELLKTNEKRKNSQQITDNLAASLKQTTVIIARLLEIDPQQAERLKKEIETLKEKYKKELHQLKKYQEALQTQLLHLPNLLHSEVPIGKNPTDNKIIEQWESPMKPIEKLQPHWELVKKYNIVNFEQGNKLTGAGFPVYIDKGAKLQRALINFFLDQATQNGYQEIQPPLIVNKKAALGTAQLPDKEGIMYSLENQDMYLISTAEIPLTNLQQDSLLQHQELPIKYVAYTPCFRREAGSWGKNTRGLNRLHQFDKVELVQILSEENTEIAFQSMCQHITKLLQQLELTYRVLQLCSYELNPAAFITHDIEVWSAGQKKWLEVSSITLFNTYQARRMNLRYKTKMGKKYCHTLNGSALALPRSLAAIIENFQTPHNIKIPAILHPYTGFETIS